ncbi:hypothetical protein [Clostridium sp. CF012]|uniref:hypothetical protein n=1 Tax=Clostridium sp. CF012 TaxID=2843319 RepID=UPI001C0CBB3B|nr:hypothetical protein [Clostridium sp. CF012]MBU3145535.1 hypothetical protein [Clostridium sp. CF012]
MLENIFETKVIGSNTIFLDIPEGEYYTNYNNLSESAAQEITYNYFKIRNKTGIPHVKHIHAIPNIHNVEIIIEIEKDGTN